MSNEKDGKNYEISKIQLANQLKMLDEKYSLLSEKSDLIVQKDSQISRIIGKSELAPISRFLESRDDSIINELELLDQKNELMVLPKNVVTVVEADHMVKIIQFEVFNNYMAILQERNGIRELKTVNLMT